MCLSRIPAVSSLCLAVPTALLICTQPHPGGGGGASPCPPPRPLPYPSGLSVQVSRCLTRSSAVSLALSHLGSPDAHILPPQPTPPAQRPVPWERAVTQALRSPTHKVGRAGRPITPAPQRAAGRWRAAQHRTRWHFVRRGENFAPQARIPARPGLVHASLGNWAWLARTRAFPTRASWLLALHYGLRSKYVPCTHIQKNLARTPCYR